MFVLVIFCLTLAFVVKLLIDKSRDAETFRFSYTSIDVSRWLRPGTSYCSGNYVTYSRRFFKLTSAVYDQKRDRFSIPCSYSYPWNNPRHQEYLGLYGEYAPKRYSKRLNFYSAKPHPIQQDGVTNITVAIFREYPHNFFHAMTQWYNVFLLSKLLKFDPKTITILLLDRGPTVHIDIQWNHLYKRVLKTSHIQQPVYFGNVLFNLAGHESLMYYFNLNQLPFVEEFSKYFMDAFNLSNIKFFSCSNISVTLVLRRDYFMYPGDVASRRNTERKFLNEAELVRTLHEQFPGHDVRTLVAEDLDLKEQLKIMTTTDVLIGMHGCVLSQILFLPPHAMVLEMYPIFWERKMFFSSIARWRNIQHEVWQNDVEEHEVRANCSTFVPIRVFREYAQHVKQTFKCTSI